MTSKIFSHLLPRNLWLFTLCFACVFLGGINFSFAQLSPLPSLISRNTSQESLSSAALCDYTLQKKIEADPQGQSPELMISLNPDCLLKGKTPAFSLQEKAEIVLHHLAEWGSGYQPDLQFAVYGGDSVKLTTDKALFPLSSELREQLQKAEIVGQHIQLSSERFAKMLSQDLLFWGSEKEISQMGPCTKQNYLLAFDNLNNTLIQPGETFNFNRYLINLKGYCKGMSSNVFLFYGGVCGVSGQLFRAGLSSPQVELGQRRGHNFRYSKYYGEQVEGDDAAVYERNKQFEFTNTSTQHLLIKTLMKGTKTYLFFITEKAGLSDQRVEIHKVRKSPLEVQIFKTIYQDRD